MTIQSDDRKARLMCSLEGLSIGDAFGERFFVQPDVVDQLIQSRALPASPWLATENCFTLLRLKESLL